MWGGGGGLSRNEVLPDHIEVFLEIPHDAGQKKNIDVFIITLLTNMWYKTNAPQKSVDIVLTATWQPHGQPSAVIEGAASLIRC